MTLNYRKAGISLAAFTGFVLISSTTTFRAQADSWDKMTLLTIDQPTQVSDTYLEPGTYMLKLANSDRHIVQIFNRDRSHIINTVIAIPNYRLNVSDKPQFTFWETPPGSAKAIRGWFWPGDNEGQEFRYPSNLRQVASVTTTAPAPVAAAAPEPAPAPAPPTAPEPQASVEPAPQPEPVIIAQNNPPPAPVQQPAPAPAQAEPAPSAPNPPDALPQTASPYSLIGMVGLLAFGLYFGVKAVQA